MPSPWWSRVESRLEDRKRDGRGAEDTRCGWCTPWTKPLVYSHANAFPLPAYTAYIRVCAHQKTCYTPLGRQANDVEIGHGTGGLGFARLRSYQTVCVQSSFPTWERIESPGRCAFRVPRKYIRNSKHPAGLELHLVQSEAAGAPRPGTVHVPCAGPGRVACARLTSTHAAQDIGTLEQPAKPSRFPRRDNFLLDGHHTPPLSASDGTTRHWVLQQMIPARIYQLFQYVLIGAD
ncbi:hypothetical protein K491DRAFT_290243 [Lophiostoma macrostomum CBS 122681]|uniref:Uncharacterized protein n=1 Tax=Lophiostoma macrostomum CBS 122681 TaxID=1314788 RepID=A0A6A6TER8_9PLEO|nr:hypothetical protein K491DRAFT_290243 [Lophiostoma macrostomum CBS 122681]